MVADFTLLAPGGFKTEIDKLGASGVRVWWFNAGADASAARPAGASADDVVIWTNTPSEPTNLGARDIWEDAS